MGISGWLANRHKTIRTVSMIASVNILGTLLGVIGSLVQAHFISPDTLGFVRKYSVVSGYAFFLSLGLFTILHRDYPILIGRGEHERARRTAAIVQSWIILSAGVICGGLLIVTMIDLFQGYLQEAAAWFIQIVAVWFVLYIGYLSSTYRSGQEFESLAKGQLLSSLLSTLVIPLFFIWPFLALVLRSVTGSVASSLYLHFVRPLKLGWCLPWREFLDLVKRGMRLYVSDYLRYIFWLTVEIWLMYRFAGDRGVGLFVFSRMLAEAGSYLSSAINQVYLPRLAYKYGQIGSVVACLKLAAKPTLLSLGISLLIICCYWFILPPVISYVFPQYHRAIPLIRILVTIQTLVVSVSLPLYLVTLTESYLTQLAAAVVGLGVFVGAAFSLESLNFQGEAVAWGTLLGQVTYVIVCFLGLFIATRLRERRSVLQLHRL